MQTRAISIDLGERERKEAAAARRFPVSVSSETPVARRDWQTGKMFDEVLSHAPGAVDLSRAPLPVLEGHDRSTTNIGVVTGLRAEGGRLRGELVLGASQRAQELAADIASGIVTGLSVGYQITEEQRDEKAKRVVATRWMPFEVSIVPIPADVSVGINRSHAMEENNIPSPSPAGPPESAIEAATRAERQRAADIRSIVRRARLPDGIADQLVNDGATLDQARAAVLDKLATASESFRTMQHVPPDAGIHFGSVEAGNDYAEDFRAAAVDSILLRSGIPVEQPHAAARDVSASTHELARLCLSRAGLSVRFQRGPELIKRALTTSEFPGLLGDALHKTIRTGYENEPASHRKWVRVAPIEDFRLQHRPIIGSAPALEPVDEHAEFTFGSLSDDETSYRVSKYGKIVALSWEALVNDNLGAFLRVQPGLGQAARRKEADTVYAIFSDNAGAGSAMQDGVNLFDATHGNVTAAGALNAQLLSTARALLRKQQALGGGYLALVPRYWIVPSEFETDAEIIMANASRRMTTEKTTPEWIESVELVVEPRLASTACFLAADPGQIDTVELGILETEPQNNPSAVIGAGPGPSIEQDLGFVRDEVRWKVRHTFGAKPLDWRGLVKMPVNSY